MPVPWGQGMGTQCYPGGKLCLQAIEPCVPMGANRHRGSAPPAQNTAQGGGVGLRQPGRSLLMYLLLPCLGFPTCKMGLVPRSFWVL